MQTNPLDLIVPTEKTNKQTQLKNEGFFFTRILLFIWFKNSAIWSGSYLAFHFLLKELLLFCAIRCDFNAYRVSST